MPVTAPPIQVPPPANLTAPPRPLPAPVSGRLQDLETNHRQVAQAYHQLASQMCRLLAFLELPRETECRPFTPDAVASAAPAPAAPASAAGP